MRFDITNFLASFILAFYALCAFGLIKVIEAGHPDILLTALATITLLILFLSDINKSTIPNTNKE